MSIRSALRRIRRPMSPPVHSTETVPCAAHCGRPIVLGQPHYTVHRTAEWVVNGEVRPINGEVVAYVHVFDCWPLSGEVVITATADFPDTASVHPAVTS